MVAEYQTNVGDTRSPAKLLIEGRHDEQSPGLPILKNLTIIGRDAATADIVLEDLRASRRHASITWNGGEYVVEDLQSLNGTMVNGMRLTDGRVLRIGDQIHIANVTLVFAPGSTIERPAAAPGAPTSPTHAPARVALEAVVAANRRRGNENAGFLSEEHGFLPSTPPLLALPPAFKAWDEIAAQLPALWRSINVRAALRELPVLDASEENLPDDCLMRASVILSMLAHSYHRISDEAPTQPMPAGVQEPWEQVSRRLERLAPHLSYVDLILYNWKLVDPQSDDPFRLSNLDLLVPTVDNQEEKVFYLVQVEAHHRMGAMVGSMIRAQEAALVGDVETLKRELIAITSGMQHVTAQTFMAIDPNSYSATYVDPVVWAKTVAPFAVPIAPGTVGPSGSGAPAFHLLDTFFGRVDYDSRLGHEMLELRSWYPAQWRTFFDAISEVSVSAFVEQSGDPVLQGIYKDAALSYAGDDGFLTQHMIKVYGYLEIAFKVGRSVTIGGFNGAFSDRVWDVVVDELTNSKVERERTFPQPGHAASIKSVEVLNPSGDDDAWIKQVVFDVSGTGMRYAPGDRCAVLPENSEMLIEKTLDALRATGDEEIQLTAEWRETIALRSGYGTATSLPLRTLLKFGRIRPIDRAVAKLLYQATDNGRLRRIIELRGEDQWELWDLLNMLTKAGFDPRRIVRAHPGERHHICRIVPMESFRMYSISSTMDPASVDGADELALTVGRLAYTTVEGELSGNHDRRGTTSHFLGDAVPVDGEVDGTVSLRVVRPSRFNLPSDSRVPIVMFGGGTGIAPFRSFIHERVARPGGGANVLFLATRTRSELYYESELAPLVADGRLQVRVAFSRDPVQLTAGTGEHGFNFEPGARRRIGEEMLADGNAELLWHLLRKPEDGGAGAHFYVCGRTGFASSVMEALEAVVHRFSDGTDLEREAKTNLALYDLVGSGRYMQDIFTTYTGSHLDSATAYPASEVVLHNSPDRGYWMVIDGRVYDMNKFGHLHPGGFKIIQASAGMDATAAFRKVEHDVNPEISAMLGMYEIGVVRRLQFGREWGTVIAPDGLRSMLLSDAYRAWIRFLYNVTEMENAFRQDCALTDQTLIGVDDPGAFPPIKLQFLLEVHDRFAANYLAGTIGDALVDLWAVTSGFCAPTSDVRWMLNEIAQIEQSREADTTRRFSREIQRRINDVVARGADESDPVVALVKDYCALLHVEDSRYLAEMKMALRQGVMAFEQHESDVVRLGSEQLMDAVQSIPGILASYQSRVLSGVLSLWMDHQS